VGTNNVADRGRGRVVAQPTQGPTGPGRPCRPCRGQQLNTRAFGASSPRPPWGRTFRDTVAPRGRRSTNGRSSAPSENRCEASRSVAAMRSGEEAYEMSTAAQLDRPASSRSSPFRPDAVESRRDGCDQGGRDHARARAPHEVRAVGARPFAITASGFTRELFREGGEAGAGIGPRVEEPLRNGAASPCVYERRRHHRLRRCSKKGRHTDADVERGHLGRERIH